MIVRCYGILNGHSVEFEKVNGTNNQFQVKIPWTQAMHDMKVYMVDDQGRQAEFKYSGTVSDDQ